MNTGIIMDVEKNEILCDGLGMPHSPRIINGDLYFLESARESCLSGTMKNKRNLYIILTIC